MNSIRFLWHDLAALWFVYQEARRRYPELRRLELVRAALEDVYIPGSPELRWKR